MKKNIILTISAAAWVFAVGAGLAKVLRYENTPGLSEQTPPDWPRTTHLPKPSGRASLLLFAHPRCPCTRATMSELARIIPRCEGKLDVSVVFFLPPNSDSDWEQTGLRREAA